MQALAIIDMQRRMFRLPERAVQLRSIVPTINRLAAVFASAGRPVFRSTWCSRLTAAPGRG